LPVNAEKLPIFAAIRIISDKIDSFYENAKAAQQKKKSLAKIQVFLQGPICLMP